MDIPVRIISGRGTCHESAACAFSGEIILPVSGGVIRYDAWDNRCCREQKLSGFYVSRTLAENYPCFRNEEYMEETGNMARFYPDFSGYFRYRKTKVSCMNLPAPLMPTGIAGNVILYMMK